MMKCFVASLVIIFTAQPASAQALTISTNGWMVHQDPRHKVAVLIPAHWRVMPDASGKDSITASSGARGVECIISYHDVAAYAHLNQEEINELAARTGQLSKSLFVDAFPGIYGIDFAETMDIHGVYAKVYIAEGENTKRIATKLPYRKELGAVYVVPGGGYTVTCWVTSTYSTTLSVFDVMLPVFSAIAKSAHMVSH